MKEHGADTASEALKVGAVFRDGTIAVNVVEVSIELGPQTH